MSMLPTIDESRWAQGMSTERFHPWYGEDLDPTPVAGTEGLTGVVSIITHLGPDGGMSYEQCEPIMGNHHRSKPSGPKPNQVRPG